MPAPHYSYSHRYKISNRAKTVRKIKNLLFNKFTFFGLLFLIILSAAFYLIYISSYFELSKIEISGVNKVDANEATQFVKQELKRKVLGFDTNSYFGADTKKIKDKMLSKFVLISDIEIKKKFPATIKVNINEKKPIITLCYDDSCFNFDQNGIPFETAEKSSSFFKISNGILIGQISVSEKNFKVLLDLKNRLQNFPEINVGNVYLKDGDGIIEMTEHGGWKILFTSENGLARQFENLKLVLEQKIPQEKRKDLEYIDLRFGDVVNFKYKSAPVESSDQVSGEKTNN